jgi:hypothetical protein
MSEACIVQKTLPQLLYTYPTLDGTTVQKFGKSSPQVIGEKKSDVRSTEDRNELTINSSYFFPQHCIPITVARWSMGRVAYIVPFTSSVPHFEVLGLLQ